MLSIKLAQAFAGKFQSHIDLDKAPFFLPLRKHAYSNILKILPPKNENFQIKNSDIFHISEQKYEK